MKRLTNSTLLWLGVAMLCVATSSVVASEPISPEQTASQILDAGNAHDLQRLKLIAGSLGHESPIVRRAAVWSLGQFPGVIIEHIDSLTSALADQDAYVRWGAANALAGIGRPAWAAEPALWQATLDRDVEVRCAALIALRTISVSKHPAALPALCECLRSPISDVQSEAIATISLIHSRWGDNEKQVLVNQLSEVFAKGTDDLRLASAALLGDLGLPAAPAMTALASATDDLDEHVQAAALRAIERIADEIDQNWSRLDEPQREELRTSCELTTRAMSARGCESAGLVALTTRMRRSGDGIQLASAVSSLELPKSANRVEATLDEVEEGPADPSSAPPNHWRWVCVILLVGLGLWGLRGSRSDPKATVVVDQSHTPLPQPAVAPISDSNSDPENLASRRESINLLSDVALDAAAALNQAMGDEDSVIRWRSASAVTAVHGATVPQLLGAVTSGDPEVRRLAITSLRGLGANAVIPFVQALQDGDARVRQAAAVTLGQIGPGAIDAVPQLIVALADSDPQVRAAAAMALSVFGAHAMEAVPELRAALSDETPTVRARAAFALGQIGSSARRAVKELARLVSDPDVSVRRNGVSALGGIGADTAVVLPALRLAANDADADVRRLAVTTLNLIDNSSSASISPPELPVTKLYDTQTVTTIEHCTTDIPQTQVSTELKVFCPESVPTDEPVIAHNTEECLEAADLIALLEDADADARWNASQKLEELGASAVPEMIASLSHRNPAVRRLLIVSLGRIGADARSAAPAMLVALHDVNSDVRCAAADCLGQFGVVTRSMLHALVQSLRDPNAEVRRYAATTLGRLGQQAHEAITALKVASISDIAAKVRTAAQTSLQRITESLAGAA